jgi:hypothetical protein
MGDLIIDLNGRIESLEATVKKDEQIAALKALLDCQGVVEFDGAMYFVPQPVTEYVAKLITTLVIYERGSFNNVEAMSMLEDAEARVIRLTKENKRLKEDRDEATRNWLENLKHEYDKVESLTSENKWLRKALKRIVVKCQDIQDYEPVGIEIGMVALYALKGEEKCSEWQDCPDKYNGCLRDMSSVHCKGEGKEKV